MREFPKSSVSGGVDSDTRRAQSQGGRPAEISAAGDKWSGDHSKKSPNEAEGGDSFPSTSWRNPGTTSASPCNSDPLTDSTFHSQRLIVGFSYAWAGLHQRSARFFQGEE